MTATDFEIAHPASLVEWDAPDGRSLRIVVQEQTGLGPLEEVASLGLQARKIIAGASDRTFEIHWQIVVCFAVRGDPFPNEGLSVKTIVEADTNSPFMTWVRATSHAEPDYVAAMTDGKRTPSPLRHWVISTGDYHIDIASPDAPAIAEVARRACGD